MDMSGQLHTFAALPPGKDSGTHRVGGWIGPRADVDVFERRKYLCRVGIQTPDLPACSLVTVLTMP
jgi:hypothetical protein